MKVDGLSLLYIIAMEVVPSFLKKNSLFCDPLFLLAIQVLLMTLQNAPPGLDYERDKRFSKVCVFD